jgi:hypothetical protein
MKKVLCAMWDSKMKSFGKAIEFPNAEVAKRSFAMLVNDPNGEVILAPEDYTLMEIGQYDPEKGTLTNLEPNKTIATALELVEAVKVPEQQGE